ncbi:hypothetical protein [Nocardioides sp. SYSU D00065]|uniref:hypothetical protein n=1 Tax=Nocardioides sp. SYSU D00065 TaxID=2817378 RepID=UPI001B33A59E|nr:hypothetical protein [Nocardioides sp. SYSU D00065]
MATKTETQEKLFSKIAEVADSVDQYSSHPDAQARMLVNLALAYRHAAGGAQPGNGGAE